MKQQYSQMELPKSKNSVLVRQSKTNQVNSFAILTKQLNLRQLASFLVGFVIGELRLGAINPQNLNLLKNLGQSLELIRQHIIDQINYIEACIEALESTKKYQSINQYKKSPKKSQQKNRMRSEYDIFMQQQQQSPIDKFNQIFSNLLSELALDGSYMKQKWKRQLSIQDEQKKTAQMIQKMMAEDNQMNQADERMSLEIIDKMIAEDMEKKKQLQQKKMQCQICLVDIQFADMAPVSNCGHIFHRQCIHQHIKAAVLSNKVDINCPMQECKSMLSTNDVETYVQGEVLDKYYQFSLNKYVQSADNMTSWCPTPGCSAVFQFDAMLDNYRCLVCRKHYCLKCRCEYHNGMSCAEYRISSTFSKEDKAFEEFVRGAKFKQCPKCKFWVERVSGCVSMACRCGVQFCYECGGTGCPHGSCSGSGRKNGEGGGGGGGAVGGGAIGGLFGGPRRR